MKAALVEQYHEPLAIRDIPEPAHDSDGVVVEVKACGVCRSDWHGWQGEWPGFTGGSLPHIFGHEFVGLVSDIGSNVSRYRVGDRVIVPFTLGCGHCEYCR
ncbi:alcohol dehydrogenase catalytic domain-containing protein, partial [Cutibacterium acnes]